MYRRHTMLITLLLAILQLAAAVTLNDFTPRLNDLTGDCKAVYTSQINGCAGADFQGGECSSSCISALQSIGVAIRKACQSVSPDGKDVVAAFLTGQGTSKLCTNAVSADKASAITSQSSSLSIGSSTMILSDTTLSATGIIVDTSSASPSVVTALSTATINPIGASSTSSTKPSSSSSTKPSSSVFTGITSTITGSSLAFATSTPSSVLMATETTLSSTNSAKHTQSSDSGGGGTPFDTSSATVHGVSASHLKLLGGLIALLFFL